MYLTDLLDFWIFSDALNKNINKICTLICSVNFVGNKSCVYKTHGFGLLIKSCYWIPHSDAYVINEESMLDWEGNMKHEKDHEKRVVLEDIPSDDTMISSLALCEKEQMAVSSYFVDQDEDINAAYGFEDEHQLYQALKMRNEHGQFAMNIGATSILDQTYLDDDDSQDSSDDDDTSPDNSDDDFDPIELDDDTNEVLLDNFMASTAQAGKSRGVDP